MENKKTYLDEVDVLRKLKREIKNAGSQKAWAAANGFSEPYISDVLRKRRRLAARILKAVRVERAIVYREIAK